MSTQKKYTINAVYNYTDEEGHILYQSVRYTPKFFRQRRILPNNSYIWGISTGDYRLGNDGHYYRKSSSDPPETQYTRMQGIKRRVPYHLQQMLLTNFIILVEGEKDVHSVEKLGFTATTNSGGVGNFSKELVPFFNNKLVAIIGDNDSAGRKGALLRAELLLPHAKMIKVISSLPHTKEHEDITDWILHESHTTTLPKDEKTLQILHNKLFHIIKETPALQYKKKTHHHTTQNITHNKKQNISSIHDFLRFFNNVTETSESHWQAQCPSHNDDTNSLSITKKQDKILLYCFAGCKTSTILDQLHLSWKDLFI